MALGRLSNLQEQVLVALAGIEPPWTLSDGAALAGFHTAHRETRDLDPVPLAEAPRAVTVGGATFLVDTPHQILVNKLCALLNRSELRDIEDIRALLDTGGDLPRALGDCPNQDGGFSPMTLSWSLRSLPVERLAASSGWSAARIDALSRFRDALLDRILEQARPDR